MSVASAASRGLWGGKAATLIELADAGFPVPPFAVFNDERPPLVVGLTSGASASETVASIVERLGFPLVVRSSASGEDGERASFAGQFVSFLDLRSLVDVERAVDACRASVRSEVVRAYCARQNLDPESLRMTVIVQRMIEPAIAGVAFSVNPSTGADEVVVEAVAGLADELLSGKQSALDNNDLRVAPHLPEIRALARRAQRHFGTPQDIEFALGGGRLWLLQSRPITRISFPPELGEWTNADFRDGGVSSGVCSPLMWSLYDFIWERTLKECMQEIRLWNGDFLAGRMFFGRPYWNLGAVKSAVARTPGFVEREFDEDLSVKINYEGDGLRTPFTLGSIWRSLPILFSLGPFFRRQLQQAETLLREFPEIEAGWERATVRDASNLRELIERDFWRVENTYFRTIYAVSLAKMEFKSAFPDSDYAELVAGLPPLTHLAPVRRLRELQADGPVDIERLALEYRHQSRFGVDIRHPRWDEDREFLKQLVDSPAPPPGQDARAAFGAARSRAASRVSWWRRGSWSRQLDRLRHFVWLREELRDISSRVYYWIRRHVLAIAESRRLGSDIFFQTFREIYDDDRSQIEQRRDIFEGYRNFAAPNEIGSRFQFTRVAEVRSSDSATEALSGIGASVGVARGKAWIARDVATALHAPVGAILVCPFTEPGWTPALDRVSAVVTETGGQLSHAAVICREYGIPAVLGVDQATSRFRTGELLEVDGGRGAVRRVVEG